MSLKTFVKVTNISNLSDARYCAGMGVDLLGFDINPKSKAFVSPELFSEITGWVAGIQTVGEIGADISASDALELISHYSLDYVQADTVELINAISNVGLPLILRLSIKNEDDWIALPQNLAALNDQVEMVILSSEDSSLFEDIDQQIQNLATQFPFKMVKSYNLSEDSAAELDSNTFYGIELSGSQEERPGFNDYGDLMDILEVLEDD